MNNQDRRMLERIYNALGAVPHPKLAGGTASASMSGFVGHSGDMRELTPWVRRAIRACAMRDVDADNEDADRIMNAVDQWVAQRRREDWQPMNGHSACIEDYMANGGEA